MNPWLTVQRLNQPYIAEIDRGAMADYIARPRSSKPDYLPQLHVVPEPWCGPILSAQVLVLSGNPHWDSRDEEFVPLVENAMWENLSGTFPLYLLQDQLIGTAGANWYRGGLLRDVLNICESQQVAQKLCLVDFVGYRSHKWDYALRMPSQQFTAECIREALTRDAVVIVTRGMKKWYELVPELEKYPRTFRNNSWQNVRLSEKNTSAEGFSAIVEMLS